MNTTNINNNFNLLPFLIGILVLEVWIAAFLSLI